MRNHKNNIIYNARSITLKLKNLTGHFTGKEKIITLCSIILISSFVNIISNNSISNTSALSYQGTANIGFTFNPTLSISVSGDLIIPNLTPGNSADSNSITVSVATNTAYGYTLTSTVGSSNNNNSIDNNSRNLVNSIDNNQTFTSLDYGSSIVDKTSFSDNTWGYSYSSDNGTTWKPYSGLPLYSDTTKSTVLYNTYNAASSISLDFKIAAKSGTTQASGEYTNNINFYAVSVPEPPLLYDVVQNMTKGTLADNNVKLSDTITQANSGVYTYDPVVYGTASDASNDYPIYFYRGILDTDVGLGTYGSDGQADAWPNYVKLNNNTCWRIVRTTGSGGVKMIYNGLYGATTAGSCGNATANAQVSSRVFGSKGNSVNNSWDVNINRVGYTFNNDTNIQDVADPFPIGTVFGDNSNYLQINATNSNIKNYIENTWFINGVSSYGSNLELSAGYCNDRSAYSDATTNSVLSEIRPYSSGAMYFGAYGRNINAKTANKVPSLSCPRGTVDLYTVSGSSNGNGQLTKPVALLTADEASFAGSGINNGTQGSSANVNSYLHSGSTFWLLSPYYRYPSGGAGGFMLNGNLAYNTVYYSYGVRPVISLMHHIQVTGGNGTATSPWTIE